MIGGEVCDGIFVELSGVAEKIGVLVKEGGEDGLDD